MNSLATQVDFRLQIYVLSDCLLRAGEIRKEGWHQGVCLCTEQKLGDRASGRMLEEFSPCLGRSQIRNSNQVAVRLWDICQNCNK